MALADEAEVTIAKKLDDNKPADVVPDLDVRPNTKQPFYIMLKNTTAVQRTYVVDVVGLKGTNLQASKRITLEANESKPIAFEPPPPPKKEEPAKTPAEAKKEAEEAAKAEPSAGVPVKTAKLGTGKQGFGFVIRVRKEDAMKGLTPAMPDRPVTITILDPSTYMTEPYVELQGSGGRRGLLATVGTAPFKMEGAKGEVDLSPSVEVAMVFPPQLALKASDLGAGSYRRSLSRTGQKVDLSAGNLPLTSSPAQVKFHFNVDGYPRAFTYSVNARREINEDRKKNKVDRDVSPAVRMFPADNSPKSRALAPQVVSGTLQSPRLATLPSKALRFRIEVDNEPPDAVLLLRIDRSGLRDFADPDEVMDLAEPKDKRVWLDVAGPDGALVVTNTVADRVAEVDVSALRGAHELQAVLKYTVKEATGDRPKEDKFVYNLIVDDTPPPAADIKVGPFPKRLERGKPLPVFISAIDPDTLIERVAVVVGKPGPDGKFPPEAVTVEAVQTTLGWVAQVPLPTPAPPPPPPPGSPPPPKVPVPPIDLTVIAENEVGLVTPKVVRIELVEPRGATLEVHVERGGRPQPGAAVTLIDGEGKQKGAGVTNAKGVILFENLPPGVYKISSVKEDSSYGLSAYAATTIPDPPPPPEKPIPVLMPLAKRR
jgi:hypothetical protein